MSSREIAFAAAGVGGDVNYIEDVFSTYLYTANGASQTITNGIDLAGEGGMVWTKSRSLAYTNLLYDTVRGVNNYLASNNTNSALTASSTLTNFNSNGFTLGVNDDSNYTAGSTSVSWTFRKQPKFFDVVTYTGDGVAGRTVAHNLGSVPGMIIVKCASAVGSWDVYHRGVNGGTNPQNYNMVLNTTAAQSASSTRWNNTAPTSTEFTVGTSANVNDPGATYVAYLFAHDAGGFGTSGTDNVISCGSFTTDASTGNADINLGYEPQYVLLKPSDVAGGWNVIDVMRGMSNTSTSRVFANTSAAETSFSTGYVIPTATGFQIRNGFYGTSQTIIYMAIRRPMKVPTDATTVFNTSLETTTTTPQTLTTGFPVDLSINTIKNISVGRIFMDRLRGGSQTYYNYLDSTATSAEATGSGASGVGFDNNTGIVDNNWWNNTGSVWWSFSRRPGFFDEVCYTATGSSPLALNHNLGTAPQMMIVKGRSGASDWPVYHIGENGGVSPEQYYLRLNGTSANSNAVANWSNTAPTATQFTVGGNNNASGYTYVAYLFATCPGVSKVGSYTGTGATQTINCGFTGGARFVLIKRTDSTGAWYVWDTARGMVSGTDPSLQLNSTAAESNADSVYTATTGFSLLASPSADVNTSGGSYIFLAIA